MIKTLSVVSIGLGLSIVTFSQVASKNMLLSSTERHFNSIGFDTKLSKASLKLVQWSGINKERKLFINIVSVQVDSPKTANKVLAGQLKNVRPDGKPARKILSGENIGVWTTYESGDGSASFFAVLESRKVTIVLQSTESRRINGFLKVNPLKEIDLKLVLNYLKAEQR